MERLIQKSSFFLSYSQGQHEENFTFVSLKPAPCRNPGRNNENAMLRVQQRQTMVRTWSLSRGQEGAWIAIASVIASMAKLSSPTSQILELQLTIPTISLFFCKQHSMISDRQKQELVGIMKTATLLVQTHSYVGPMKSASVFLQVNTQPLVFLCKDQNHQPVCSQPKG